MASHLLVFDSESQQNLGCRVTSRGIKGWLGMTTSTLQSIPASDIFDLGRSLRKQLFVRLSNKAPLFFRRAALKLIDTEVLHRFEDILSRTEVVIINGEGTLHHDRLTGLLLLSIGALAKRLGKKVVLLNATIEAMSAQSLAIISSFDFVVLRDSLSAAYLRRSGITAVTPSFDFAWHELIHHYPSQRATYDPTSAKGHLFTPGANQRIPASIDAAIAHYLIVDEDDRPQSELFLKSVEVPPHSESDVEKFIDELRTYGRFTSGRHHLNIIALFVGVPLEPLKSNSWKIEGTLLDLKKLTDIRSPNSISERVCDEIRQNFTSLRHLV